MSAYDVISLHPSLKLPDNRLKRTDLQFREFISTPDGGAYGAAWCFEVDENYQLCKVTDNWFLEKTHQPEYTTTVFNYTGHIWVHMTFDLPDPGYKEWWQYRDYLEIEYRNAYPSSYASGFGEHEWRITFEAGKMTEMIWRNYLPESEQEL